METACELLERLWRGYQLVGNSLLAKCMQFVMLSWLKPSTNVLSFINVYTFASVSFKHFSIK